MPGNLRGRDGQGYFPVEANAKGFFHMGPFKEGEVLPVLTVVGLSARRR